MYDPHTRDSRGFGFVMMDSPEDAVRAIETLDKKELMGKLINVQHVSLPSPFFYRSRTAHRTTSDD